MVTSAASNTYQINKVETRNHEHPNYIPYPPKPSTKAHQRRITKRGGTRRTVSRVEDREREDGLPEKTDN